jgi:hypothetical protein
MSKINDQIYQGGCHCGRIRFQVRINLIEAIQCNCSICRKKGFIHYLVSADDFNLLQGAEYLSTYTFNTHTAQHTFCQICGIHSFYKPRSHPDQIDVNLHCLDEYLLEHFSLKLFDGQNWEANINQIIK